MKQKEQVITWLKKMRDKHLMFSDEWEFYNNKVYKLENYEI